MTAHSLWLALMHHHTLSWPGSYTWPPNHLACLLNMTAYSLGLAIITCLLTLMAWFLYNTANSLRLPLMHDCSLSWPESYAWPLTLLAWHSYITAHPLCLVLIYDHLLSWPGSFTWPPTPLTWLLSIILHPPGMALKHDCSLPWAGSYAWQLTPLAWLLNMTALSLSLAL